MDAGPRIGSYVVREILGQGGMGTVYLAEHTVIGKKVAIKVLKRDLAGHDTLVARFINEARANAVVGHPGIVDVFDFGTLPSGVPYLVMEYLQGESLAQRIAKVGRLPIKLAATVAWETASAVGAAHAKGIVHRDLKPENLFLTRDPSAPEVEKVKVLDFGIAKLHASPSQISTQTGAVMGTPVYMSPEQCRGARDEVDHRTDIYSLGVILYEMLAGKPPFQGEAFGDLLLRHMTEAPAPLGPLNPEVPAFLEEVVMRALAKRREDRFSSMRELQKALSGATEGLAPDKTPAPFDVRRPARTLTPPIIARTPAITPDLGSRRRGWLVGGGLALLLGLTGLVVSRANRTPAPAVVARPAPAVVPRVEPLPAPPPPDASPAATTASPTGASPPHPTSRPAGSPSDKKRGNRKKIDVQQW
jgi:serine/threonine-protein kinase